MTARRVVRAMCPKKGHTVAELLVGPNGHRLVRLARLDVQDLRGDGVGRDVTMGGDLVDLDDESDPFRWDRRRAACRCGLSFYIVAGDLLKAAGEGTGRVVLRPRRL